MKEAGMKPNWITTLIVAALIGIAGYAALFLAPTERTMGLIPRIFYFHVPSASAGFVAYFIPFIASVSYLLRRAPGSGVSRVRHLCVSGCAAGVHVHPMVADAAPPASNCGRQRLGPGPADVARLLDLLGGAARSVDRAGAPAVPARVIAPHRRRNDCRSRTPQRRPRADTVHAGGEVRSG